jgi:hypothetical protein
MKAKRNSPTIILVLGLLGLMVLGCGRGDPAAPDVLSPQHPTAPQASSAGNHVLWGIWQFRIGLEEGSVEIVPLRSGMAHVNVVDMLEPPILKFLRYDEDTLEVDMAELSVKLDIILEHPLPGYPEFLGFDVRGIVITDGNYHPYPPDMDLVMSSSNQTRLVNADGYTRWWNPREFPGGGILGYVDGLLGKPDIKEHFSSTLNGFKYFADGLGPQDEIMNALVVSGRGRFSPSSANRRHYDLRFGPTQKDFMVFNYAVDASWEMPLSLPPKSFADFPITANSLEPFNIDVTEEVNSLYYDPTLEECPPSGGVVRLRMDVATWQGLEGIGEVLIGSPDLGLDFEAATEIGGHTLFNAHVSTYIAELVPDSFNTRDPLVLIVATSNLGSYKEGPESLPIKYTGPSDAPLALYELYAPRVLENSPPVVRGILGPTSVTAGDKYSYEVEDYWDCQDFEQDLTFAWEIGDDKPPLYNDGMGKTDGIHPGGDGTIEVVFPDEGLYMVDASVIDMDGAVGYSENPLEVTVSLPPPPAMPEGLNLKLSVCRTPANSYEYAFSPEDIPSIDVEWDGLAVMGKVAEWAIYRDNDPYDGEENWVQVGATAPLVWKFSNKLTGPGSYNSGGSYFFKVHPRSLAGNPGSDSVNSTEWAFVEFENAEPDGASADQHPWSVGYGGAYSTYFREWKMTGEGGATAGGCWMTMKVNPTGPGGDPFYRAHTWTVLASQELPILTDPELASTTEEWYIELIFGGQVTPMNECWLPGQRLSVGTVPDDPSSHNGFSTYYDYDEAWPSHLLFGTPYYTTQYWSFTNTRFDETPATYNDRYGWGRDEYGFPICFSRFRLVDLDPSGTARTRAAIGFGSGSYDDALARPRADEIAVVIY